MSLSGSGTGRWGEPLLSAEALGPEHHKGCAAVASSMLHRNDRRISRPFGAKPTPSRGIGAVIVTRLV